MDLVFNKRDSRKTKVGKYTQIIPSKIESVNYWINKCKGNEKGCSILEESKFLFNEALSFCKVYNDLSSTAKNFKNIEDYYNTANYLLERSVNRLS